jgi:hypothetical protein
VITISATDPDASPEPGCRRLQVEWHHNDSRSGISSFLWALIFFLFLWFGMAAVGVSRSTAQSLRSWRRSRLPVRPHRTA